VATPPVERVTAARPPAPSNRPTALPIKRRLSLYISLGLFLDFLMRDAVMIVSNRAAEGLSP
jgi:hypothetical protein